MATSFLGINMSGRKLTVVNSNGNKIGVLYHKERFTYSFDLRTIRGRRYKKIWFLNPHGHYVEGFLLNSDPIKNWDEYEFSGFLGHYFKIDRTTIIYDEHGNEHARAHAGDFCKLQNRCETGSTYKYLGRLEWCIKKDDYVDFSRYRNYYIDTGVEKNSMNTAVYGDWN